MQPSWLLPAVLAAAYVVLFAAERFLPLRGRKTALWPRVLLNAAASALAFGAAAVTVRPAVAQALRLGPEENLGLLRAVELPAAVEFAVAFLLMDWSFYWWHQANHRIPLLWRFHNVHHIDPDLDVTTGFRFHAGEVAASAGFRVLQVTLIGLSGWAYFTYELVFQANTLFHHSNVRLPVRVERVLNLLLVTPRMHGIHHSHYHDETDSNYSVVLSWWDRLHRSLRLSVPQDEVVIGVPGYAEPDDNRFWNLVLLPFRRQRDYWKRPDGTPMESRPDRP
ncbi:MAG: sterol desaturase family protein [Planctomycetes bacterium]|nr:sterol desaturase family protein [Planctomycetota bacterium]